MSESYRPALGVDLPVGRDKFVYRLIFKKLISIQKADYKPDRLERTFSGDILFGISIYIAQDPSFKSG